ncbi:RNA 2',3'-cyclic phosphodiesterase [candidate division WOR-3 bacterium]|nr:RNA 2',3'-cyclic phosphodiesterase [candidate division WOR-3 bacterium]
MRVFIATKIPDSVREKISILQEQLKETQTGVRWVNPDNVHLTLKFLGEVEETRISEISSAIKSSIKGILPFHISFSSLDAFPNLKYPKVLWIGVKEGKEKLIELMSKLDTSLSRLGFEPETRKPSPHLTIGRVKKNKNPRLPKKLCGGQEKFEVQSFETRSFLTEKVYLIKSTLTPEGPEYTDIAEY